MIRTGDRPPPRSLAILLYRKLGWRHALIDGLSEEEIVVLEKVEPWTPPAQRAEAQAG